MESIDSIDPAPLLAKGATANVYAWDNGCVLKLFIKHNPWHANEVAATKIAHKANLPVPEVIEGLIEVDQQEGIVFERIDGPTMSDYLKDHPGEAERCARQAAELQAQIHSTKVTDLPLLEEILILSIHQANPLEEKTRKAILDLLNGLPAEEVLCHNDFYPNNIMVSPQGLMVVIDWAAGSSGNPLADYARTWLISKFWLDKLYEIRAPENVQLMWREFWDTFFRRYGELRPSSLDEFNHWLIVAAAASLYWDISITSTDNRVSFIKAALCGAEHPWLNCSG